MIELKRRIEILNFSLSEFSSAKVLRIPSIELACLQLRKIYELVIFASLCANKEKYIEFREKYEKDWNLADIAKKIEKFNPNFLPIKTGMIPQDHPIVPVEIKQYENTKFEKAQIIKDHGFLGNILHASNPYAPPIDYGKYADFCVKKHNEIVAIMNDHKVEVVKDELFYHVAMQTPDGDIEVVAYRRCELPTQ